MKNPLKRAIQSGVRANDRIGDMFARLGTGEHSRGVVPSIYRVGRQGLAAAMQAPNTYQAATDVLVLMRSQLLAGINVLNQDAVNFGLEESTRQLGYYDIHPLGSINLFGQSFSATESVLARFDAQAANIKSLIQTGADPVLITGDEERVGALRSGDILVAGAFWIAFLAWMAWNEMIEQSAPDRGFQKQVVAALDNRTTECCLRAHGQVQPLEGKFDLTGTPRFADKIDWTPFHGYCRSAVVLYLAEFDDGLSARMRATALQILAEREQGIWKDRNPADAFG